MTDQTAGTSSTAEPGPAQSIDWADTIGDGGLVVVSNRQPYSHTHDGNDIEVEFHAAGLTSGLDPVMRAVGGTRVAWGGRRRRQ